MTINNIIHKILDSRQENSSKKKSDNIHALITKTLDNKSNNIIRKSHN